MGLVHQNINLKASFVHNIVEPSDVSYHILHIFFESKSKNVTVRNALKVTINSLSVQGNISCLCVCVCVFMIKMLPRQSIFFFLFTTIIRFFFQFNRKAGNITSNSEGPIHTRKILADLFFQNNIDKRDIKL